MTNLNVRQLAERLGCSESHVRKLVQQGAVPHFKLGARVVRFRLSAIEVWEANGGTTLKPSATPQKPPAPSAKPLPPLPTIDEVPNWAPPPQQRRKPVGL